MLNLYFPVRTVPIAEESLKGYSMRLLKRNGRKRLSELFSILNLKYSISCFTWDTPEFNQFIKKLAPFVWYKPNALKCCFNSKLNKLYFDECRFIRSFKLQSVKLCPCCFQDDSGYLKASWELANVTHCEIHQCLLIDSCPNCHRPIEWQTDLFRGCTNCEHKWSSKDANKSLVPVYQKEFVQRTIKQGPILDCIAKTLVIVMRPHDYMYESIKMLKQSNEQMHYYMGQAHELLASKAYRTRWLLRFTDTNIFPIIESKFLPIALDALAGEYPIKKSDTEVSLHPVSASDIVRKNRLEIQHNCPVHFQISLNEAALILNLKSIDTSTLRDINVINSINSPLKNKDLLFDLRSITDISKTIINRGSLIDNANTPKLIKVSDLFRLLDLYLLSKPKIIQLLINIHEFNLYKTKHTNIWHEVLINKSHFLKVLDSIYTQYLPHEIPPAKSGKLLGLSHMLTGILLSRFPHLPPNENEEENTDSSIFYNFMNDYLVLNRWCKLNDFQPIKVTNLLQAKGIEPFFSNAGLRKVYIYEQCPKLDSELEIIKMYLDKAEPQITLLKEAYLLTIEDSPNKDPLGTALFGRIVKARSGYKMGARVLTSLIINLEQKRPFKSQSGGAYNTYGIVKTLKISYSEWSYLKKKSISPDELIELRKSK